MKYIKKFEKIAEGPGYGDDGIFDQDELVEDAYHAKLNSERKKFINSNVGMVINVSNKENLWIEIQYDEEIPTYNNNKILLTKDNMIAYSKDKDELEARLSANKYNL